jgi:hypothetical protein
MNNNNFHPVIMQCLKLLRETNDMEVVMGYLQLSQVDCYELWESMMGRVKYTENEIKVKRCLIKLF